MMTRQTLQETENRKQKTARKQPENSKQKTANRKQQTANSKQQTATEPTTPTPTTHRRMMLGHQQKSQRHRQRNSHSVILVMIAACVAAACLFHEVESFVTVTVPAASTSTRTDSGTRSRRHMFTGIVEEIGTVVALEQNDEMTLWDGSKGSGTELTLSGKVVMQDAYLGCSICVSGVCLTATKLDFDSNIFKVGLAPETLRKSYLGKLTTGDAVNLERASEIGGRNSGHFVQGHVDGIGTIIDRWIDQDSLFFKIQVEPDVLKYIVTKGFIAIDGTSLTVCEVNTKENWFTFMLVEYTQKKIIIPSKQKGGTVNIEVDVLGKYSENTLAAMLPRIEALEATVESLQKEMETRSNDNSH